MLLGQFTRRLCGILSLGIPLLIPVYPAMASDNYPHRAVKIVVAYPAGGGVDAIARALQDDLSAELNQAVIIENKPGGATQIASISVINSAPDGYTFLLGTWSSLSVTPALYRKTVQFDPIEDFVPVTSICRTPFLFALPKASPANSVAEFIELAKKSPGKLNYGSWGAGSSPHVLTELLQAHTGIQMTHIPFKGSAPALTELIAGRLDFLVDTVGPSLPHKQAGYVKVIAFTGSTRSIHMPDVPTMKEAGVADFVYGTWYGLFAPKGTPQPVIGRMSSALAAALKKPKVQQRLELLGAQVELKSPDEFSAFFKADVQKWRKNLQALNIGLE